MYTLLTALVLGCTGNTSDTGDTHSGPVSFTPDMPTTACSEGHDWLPTETMGDIVYEELDWSLSLSKDAIDGLLNSNGLSPAPLYRNSSTALS